MYCRMMLYVCIYWPLPPPQVCKGPHDEDKMVFCDDCDRGYHLFCVGLNEVPSGDFNYSFKKKFIISTVVCMS